MHAQKSGDLLLRIAFAHAGDSQLSAPSNSGALP